MNIVIAAVGRLRRGPEYELLETYRRRLQWPFAIQEVEEKRPLPPAERRKREAALLQGAVPADALLVALDEGGAQVTSPDFARRIAAWQDEGVRTLAFVIGGADGLEPAFRDAAHLKIAFGTMTWPHMLARCMLVEQLYRAQQILAGHPYHKS
jgi:23S rRNA (pseudouridine1915-N3)-methyltransferase